MGSHCDCQHDRIFNFPNGPPNLLTDQVELGDLLHPIRSPVDFTIGKNIVEDVTGIDQSDQCRIPRLRDLVGQEYAGNAEFYLTFGPSVHKRIAPRPENPEEFLVATFKDAVLNQSDKRLAA